jgi:hypothetical protein
MTATAGRISNAAGSVAVGHANLSTQDLARLLEGLGEGK